MAITLPGAQVRLLPGKSRVLLQPRWITVHTMVGTLNGTESYFTPAGRPYSHLGLGGDGEIRQWQDLAYRAASDLEGNPYSISIECADHGPEFPRWTGSDVPPFTPAQVDSLIVGLSWLCHRFGLPKAAITTSCPHERGIGYHRLGVDPWRNKACGLRWSSARGKVCPGDRRIHQLTTEIIPRVSAPQGGDMPLTDDDVRRVAQAVWNHKVHHIGDSRQPATLVVRDIATHARAGARSIDTATLAEALAKRLPGTSGPVRVADLEEALRRVLGSLDD